MKCKLIDRIKRLNTYIKKMTQLQLHLINEENLEQFVNDPDWHIREATAHQGYGLKQLINDPDPDVRASALNYNA